MNQQPAPTLAKPSSRRLLHWRFGPCWTAFHQHTDPAGDTYRGQPPPDTGIASLLQTPRRN